MASIVTEQMSAPTLSRRLFSEEVAEFLKGEILAQRLKPGTRLVEAEIAERFKLSKSPIREAFRLLAAEGLVVSEAHRGSFVAKLDLHDILELGTLRAALEGFAAQLAAERISVDDIRELENIVDSMETAQDEVALSELHIRFHETLTGYSAHSRVIAILNGLRSQIHTQISLTNLVYQGREAVAREHRILLDALKSGEPAIMRSLVEKHVYQAFPRLQEFFSEK